jgi:hypothetical protein
MSTSNPNIPPPAGAGEPDPDRTDTSVDPLLQDKLEGAVPDADDPQVEPDADRDTDSVDDDRRRSGAS